MRSVRFYDNKPYSSTYLYDFFLASNLASRYDDKGSFLNAMILEASEMSEGDGVNLFTVHASKGLEFKEVFVVDLMDGRFPNRKLISKGSSIEEKKTAFLCGGYKGQRQAHTLLCKI